ncbi:hypothetical protein LCGC14_2821780 [marine sediment metagenome]|uniref:Calcineurin-like phosphoesterase domain-containing protein n=1 Tax=marine sediment metagenome TaxID=412755 RepID=A0A0F9AQ62_9ZZZZ
MSIRPQVRCVYDACCTFDPRSANHVYCTEHKCRRRSENEGKRLHSEALFEQPREFKTEKVSRAPNGTRIMIVNDLQRPFQDDATLEGVEKFWEDFAPHYEVYAGDVADLYTISTFDKNPSRRFKLFDECKDTKQWLVSHAEANPSAKRIWIDGNHEDRMRRWLWKYGEEMSSLPELDIRYQLGITEVGATYLSYMSVFDFLGYRIEHGFKTSASKAYPINVSRFMAIATGSSGLCGHTHHFSNYAWTDSRGSHSYIENGCLCRMDLEFAPFPNWQHAFTYGVVHNNKVHLHGVQIYPDGFRANGEFYPRRG